MDLNNFLIFGGSTGGNTSTWEGDYGFIYEFIDILKYLLETIMGVFKGFVSGSTTTPEAGDGTDTENGAGGTEG